MQRFLILWTQNEWLLLDVVHLQTRSYFLLLDLGAEDAVLEWVRALLQSIK